MGPITKSSDAMDSVNIGTGTDQRGLSYVKDAFALDNKDAEVIYNLIQIYILNKNTKRHKKWLPTSINTKNHLSL